MSDKTMKCEPKTMAYVKKEGKILVEKGAAALSMKGCKPGTSTKVGKHGTGEG